MIIASVTKVIIIIMLENSLRFDPQLFLVQFLKSVKS